MMGGSAISDVMAERARQDGKWGIQNHSQDRWLKILGEEVGEVCKASLECEFGNGNLDNYRKELVEVAAVAVAAIECYDRHNDAVGSVYLAGPIKDCSGSDVMDWRRRCELELKCKTINPAALRDFSQTPCDDCMNEIVSPDKNDIDRSAIVLANCWQSSAGTSMEILYAWERGKLVVAVVPDDGMTSAWIIAHSHVLFHVLADAVSYINGIHDRVGLKGVK